VWQYGRDLLVLLNAKPGERILDVGCGPASSPPRSRNSAPRWLASTLRRDDSNRAGNFPQVVFEVADAAAMPYSREFDLVISNAALHWVRDQRGAIASIARALKPGGRLVLEMGGRGNLRHLLEAVYQALRALGMRTPNSCRRGPFPPSANMRPCWNRRT